MNRKAKQSRGFLSGAVVVMAVFVTYVMVQLPLTTDDAKTADDTAQRALKAVSDVQQQSNENRQGLLEANRRLKAAGEAPVPVPTPTPVAVSASDGLNAAEYAQVRALVDAEVSKAKAPITQAEVTQIARVAATFVPKPKDGKSVTAAELQPLVAIALATYCGEDRCTGRSGDDGAKGDTGDQGEPGKDAPKVTDEQLRPLIATSLEAYCAQDSKPCAGKVGEKGDPGPAGRGIKDTDCIGSGDESFWRFLYSDGTTSDESGPCRLATLPPTVTPSVAKAGR